MLERGRHARNRQNHARVPPPLASPVKWLWLAASLRATGAVSDPSVTSESNNEGSERGTLGKNDHLKDQAESKKETNKDENEDV